MDKNGKLLGKVSIIDLFVALIIVIIIAGTVYRFASPATAVDQGNVTIRYTVMVDGVRDFTVQYYQVGLPVFDRMTNQHLGRIVGMTYEPQYAFGIAADGSSVRSPRPGVKVVYVEIEANGRETDAAYFAEGTFELRVGGTVFLTFRYIEVQATVHEISVVGR